jgi:hypothetical protein
MSNDSDEISDYNVVVMQRNIILSLLVDDDDENTFSLVHLNSRSPSLFRQRWQSTYLRALAENENSFISEYRLSPRQFDVLVHMLQPALEINESMARRALNYTGSSIITPASRVASALLTLAGGRYIESMRTHGISKSFHYSNLHVVVNAINRHPGLAVNCDVSQPALRSRADQFQNLGSHELFQFCTGAIDGLAIHIQAPSSRDVKNQKRFFSGSKMKFCINMQGNILYNFNI